MTRVLTTETATFHFHPNHIALAPFWALLQVVAPQESDPTLFLSPEPYQPIGQVLANVPFPESPNPRPGSGVGPLWCQSWHCDGILPCISKKMELQFVQLVTLELSAMGRPYQGQKPSSLSPWITQALKPSITSSWRFTERTILSDRIFNVYLFKTEWFEGDFSNDFFCLEGFQSQPAVGDPSAKFQRCYSQSLSSLQQLWVSWVFLW